MIIYKKMNLVVVGPIKSWTTKGVVLGRFIDLNNYRKSGVDIIKNPISSYEAQNSVPNTLYGPFHRLPSLRESPI